VASPCAIEDRVAPRPQVRARVGAYYFDGWSGPLTNPHFDGLVAGPYQDRQPLTGWRDNDPCVIEQQLVWAREFGLSFFVYDWYFKAKEFSPTENLNSAIELTHALPDRHGMQYAILYVNHPPSGNELSEGSYLVPTVGDRKDYGTALAGVLAARKHSARGSGNARLRPSKFPNQVRRR
jgi:hypothetical protein